MKISYCKLIYYYYVLIVIDILQHFFSRIKHSSCINKKDISEELPDLQYFTPVSVESSPIAFSRYQMSTIL